MPKHIYVAERQPTIRLLLRLLSKLFVLSQLMWRPTGKKRNRKRLAPMTEMKMYPRIVKAQKHWWNVCLSIRCKTNKNSALEWY